MNCELNCYWAYNVDELKHIISLIDILMFIISKEYLDHVAMFVILGMLWSCSNVCHSLRMLRLSGGGCHSLGMVQLCNGVCR